MDGAVAFKVVLLAAVLAILAGIIGAIWPYRGTRWVVGVMFAAPVALVTPNLLTAQRAIVGTTGQEPNGDLARVMIFLAIGAFLVGFLSARFGTGIRQDFAAVESPSKMKTDEKVK